MDQIRRSNCSTDLYYLSETCVELSASWTCRHCVVDPSVTQACLCHGPVCVVDPTVTRTCLHRDMSVSLTNWCQGCFCDTDQSVLISSVTLICLHCEPVCVTDLSASWTHLCHGPVCIVYTLMTRNCSSSNYLYCYVDYLVVLNIGQQLSRVLYWNTTTEWNRELDLGLQS